MKFEMEMETETFCTVALSANKTWESSQETRTKQIRFLLNI